MNYTALLLVLDTREAVSGTRDRLKYGFMANGLADPSASTPAQGSTKIYVGDDLCS